MTRQPPEGHRWLTPTECHGTPEPCDWCSGWNPYRRSTDVMAEFVRAERIRGRLFVDNLAREARRRYWTEDEDPIEAEDAAKRERNRHLLAVESYYAMNVQRPAAFSIVAGV